MTPPSKERIAEIASRWRGHASEVDILIDALAAAEQRAVEAERKCALQTEACLRYEDGTALLESRAACARAVNDRDDAIAERDEARAQVVGLRGAATHLVQHIDEALDPECADRACDMAENIDGGWNHSEECRVEKLARALSSTTTLAAETRRAIRAEAFEEVGDKVMCGDHPRFTSSGAVADWLRELAEKERR